MAAWMRAPLTGKGWTPSILIAVSGVVLATGLLLTIKDLLGEGDTALLYMPVIVGIAAIGGVRAGLISAVAGFLAAKYFFIPTYYSLAIRDPKDWTSLFVFVMLGLAMGIQTRRMQARERESAWLYRLSGVLAAESSLERLCERVVREVANLNDKGSAVLFLRDADRGMFPQSSAGVGVRESEAHRLADDCTREAADCLDRDGLLALKLTAEDNEGVLVVAGSGSILRRNRACLLASVAQLTATHICRQRLQQSSLQAERLLAQAEALREADRLKCNLIASLSHELKTPLAIVTGILTNLLDPGIDRSVDATREGLRKGAAALVRMDSCISDLLDLSRLESGSWIPKREWITVDEIVDTLQERLSVADRARLRIDVPVDLPMIYVDDVQWLRMLGHLVENALVYSGESSQVTVSARVDGTDLVVAVEDLGPGVASDEVSRIFEDFYRGRASSTIKTGNGLGLAISREIVEYHGGRIWVEPRFPRGARFVVQLPVGVPPSPRVELMA